MTVDIFVVNQIAAMTYPPSFDESPPAPFDLHAAESAAQVAAIWLVLKALTRDRLKDFTPAKRAAYLDRLLKAAETITLPTIDDPDFRSANEWIAHRYWVLITEFVEHLVQNGETGIGSGPN